jgi:hypothetical protein
MPPVWKPIKEIIRKPIKWIGDTIEDIGDWVVDEIIDPIVSTVESTIDAMLDDPIKTIATIALLASPYAWALPLLEGAYVAKEGGDIGDILEATAKAYVAQQVGASVGDYAGSAAQGAAQASTSAATAKIVGQVVAKGTSNAVGAIVYGQDPAEAFLKGGIQAGVAAGLGKLSENTDFKNLPQAAKNVIETSLTAALTGEDITPAMIASAVTKAYVTTEAVGKYFDPSFSDDWDEEQMSSMSDGQIAAITNGILNTANAAFTGGDIPKAILDSVMKYGSQELNKVMDKTIKNTIDKVSGNYETTEKKAQEVDDALDDYEAAAANYNVTADEMKPRFDERARLKGNVDELKVKLQNQDPGSNVDTANRDKYQAILNEYNASVKTYNSYATQLDNDYTNKYKPLLDKYKTEADTAYASIEPLKKDYIKLKDLLISSADQLDDALKPMQAATDKAFVTAMTGEDFNAEEYAKVNGLDDGGETGEEIDPYYHWLTTGKDENLPTNQAQYDKQLKTEKYNLFQNAMSKTGLDITKLNKYTRKRIQDEFNENYKTLQDVKNANIEDVTKDIGERYINEQTFIDDLLVSKEEVSDASIANGSAIVISDGGDISFTTPDKTADTDYRWDPRFNKKVKTVVTKSKSGLEGKYDTVIEDEEGNIVQSKEYLPPFEGNNVYGLLKKNPAAGINIIGELDPNSTSASISAMLGNDAYTFIKQAYKYAKTSDSNFLKNSAGVVLSAGGELLSSYNSMLRYVNINPKGTAVSEFSKKLLKLSGDITTEDHKKEAQDIQRKIAEANKDIDPNAPWYEKSWNVAKAIYGAASDAPGTFAAEYVAKELIQEIPTLLVGGVVAKGAKYTFQAGSWLATKLGLTAAVGLDLAETMGGTSEEAYNEAYAAAKKSGMSDEDADAFAEPIAKESGIVAGIANIATMGLGGNKVQKAIFGGKKKSGNFSEAFEVIKTGAGEGLQEFTEEGLSKAYSETQIVKIDPDRDVIGNITANALLGLLAGSSTGVTMQGVITTGDYVSSALATFNPKVNKIITEAGNTAEGADIAKQQLTSLGITDKITQTNLLNKIFGEGFTSTEDVNNAFQKVKDVYKPTANEMSNFVGESSDADFATVLHEYVDKGTVDKQEVLQLAASEGITLTPEQVAQLIGQKNEQTFLQEQQKIFDPQAVTKEEATKFLADQGYNPTEEEVLSFVAEVEESKQQAAIQKYSEDRLTTKDEAIAYLESLGLDTAQLPNEFIDSFVKQGLQTETEQQIKEAADPYYVDEQEVLDAYKAAGLPDVRPEDVQKLIGQYSESDLGKKLTKALGGAQYNVLKYNIGAPSTDDVPATGIFAELEKLQAEGASQSEAIAALSEKLNISVEDLKFQIQTVEAGLQEQIYEVGDQVAEVSDQLTQTEAKLTKQLQELVSAGATQDEAIQALSDKLGISVEDLNSQITGVETKLNQKITDVETGLTEQITDVETGLTEQITDVETGLTEQITDVETGLTSEITAIADIIGKPVGEVTDVDIDFITDLIAQQTALADPSTFEFTTDMLQYDVTGDGIVDIADQTMLQNAMQGQDVQFAQDSKFGPTGVFDTIADTKTDLTQQIKDSQQEITTMYQTDQAMQAQKAAEEKQKAALAKQRMGNLEQLYAAAQPQTVSAKQVELANIGPQYDFESIFRDTGQQSFYKTPYRKGGQVDNINDRLLKLIGDS